MFRMMGAGAIALAAGIGCAEPTVVFSDGPGSVGGGVLQAVTTAHGSFDTFCVEAAEGLTFGLTYEYTVGTAAKHNGQGGGYTNPLDAETAFLFTAFNDGEIRDILGKPGMTDEEVANGVQRAIWYIENGRSTSDGDALALIQAADDAVSSGDWSGLGSVRVMNIWNVGHVNDPQYAQQDTLLIIPLPSAGAMAGCGLLLVAARRRRG